MRFKRAIILLLDSVGIGALPDAHLYGDEEANTFKHVAEQYPGFSVPNFEKLGMGNIESIKTVKPVSNPMAHYGKCAELSPGKDTTTGHWEIAGVVLEKPFSVWPNGFSEEIIKEFTEKTGFEVLGNMPYSGTEIIKKYGEEHMKTGKLIVYTSADSVFQIAAHEEVVPVEKLYEVCRIARKILDKYNVARVIARPFVGTPGNFKRTYNRKDFSMKPPHKTLLDLLLEKGFPVIGIGKIKNIYADQGVSVSIHTEGNKDGLNKTKEAIKKYKQGLIFTNLVDFDMLWGHRNNVSGYALGLMEVDSFLPQLLDELDDDDLFIITADHGCDPTLTYSTDHTREYIPLLVYHRGIKSGKNLGIRKSFADIGQTIAENFGIKLKNGESFLSEI